MDLYFTLSFLYFKKYFKLKYGFTNNIYDVTYFAKNFNEF